MRRALPGFLALFVLGPSPFVEDPAARADRGDSRREGVAEVAHRVRVELDRGVATYTVTRTWHNHGWPSDADPPQADDAYFHVELPTGGVATGLRMRIAGSWHDGQLLPAKVAEARYHALTTGGREIGRRGPALLSWMSSGMLAISVYPVRTGRSITVEYTLRAPACYVAGHHVVDYTIPTDPDESSPSIRAAGGGRVFHEDEVEDQLGVSDFSDACDFPGVVASGGERRMIAFPARQTDAVHTRLSRFSSDDLPAVGDRDRQRPRFEIVDLSVAAAPRLARVPRRARVVFVVDGSRSQGSDAIASQLELVGGYLAHVPDARFDVVIYRRFAQPLFGRLESGRDAPGLLAGVPAHGLQPGNGSHLDRGLERAARILRGDVRRSPAGPTRIVVFTDDRVRAALTPERLARAVADAPAGTLVHVVATDLGTAGSAYGYERDDEHWLAELATSTGGMAGQISGGTSDRAAANRVMLGLVRPIQIDGFVIEAERFGDALDDVITVAPPDALAEGRGVRRFWVSERRPGSIAVRGKIWGRAIRRTLTIDRHASQRLPALVFGHQEWDELPDDVVFEVAAAGGVVSPKTSYLARDRRAPPVSRLSSSGGGTSSVTCSCAGMLGQIRRGHGYVGTAGDKPDHQRLLRKLLAPAVAACAAQHRSSLDVMLTIETTGVEIVDVEVTRPAASAMSACVERAAWALWLDDRFAVTRGPHTVDINRGR